MKTKEQITALKEALVARWPMQCIPCPSAQEKRSQWSKIFSRPDLHSSRLAISDPELQRKTKNALGFKAMDWLMKQTLKEGRKQT